MRPVTINPQDPVSALNEIQRASHENDLSEIAQNFSIGNAPGAQRTLNGSSVQLSAAGIGNGADTTDDTLFTYSLPAGALSVVGEGLSLTAFGTFANNGNNKRVRLAFGLALFGFGIVTTANVSWILKVMVFKTGASTQLSLFEGTNGTAPVVTYGTLAITDTSPIIIKVTGASTTTGAANDVVCNGMIVSALVSDVSDAFATWISDCQKGGVHRTT